MMKIKKPLREYSNEKILRIMKVEGNLMIFAFIMFLLWLIIFAQQESSNYGIMSLVYLGIFIWLYNMYSELSLALEMRRLFENE